VGGTFQTFDARLQVGDGVLESAHAAVDLRMRELDLARVSAAVRSTASSVRASFPFRCSTEPATS
jgi:hypothetical protein